MLGDSSEDVPSAGVERWTGIELSPSAARLGEIQGVLISAAKVSTNAELQKFHDMWHSYLVPGRRSLLDFPASALEWNADEGSFRTHLQEDAVSSGVVLENVSNLWTFICFAPFCRSTFAVYVSVDKSSSSKLSYT